MTDKYMYSGNPKGPFFAIGVHPTPQQALEVARASFEWKVIYIAKMRLMGPDDIFPASFIDSLSEDIAIRYGNAIHEEIIARIVKNRTLFLDFIWKAGESILTDDPVYVQDMVHEYQLNQSVRPADFNKELQAQIAQQKTLEGIEAQQQRKLKEEQELRDWLDGGKELKPKLKLDDLLYEAK